MSGVSLALALMVVGLVGCMRPIRLDISSVPQASAAKVTARLTKGTTPPAPDACDLPCGVAIAPGTAGELTVRAPGYYPAVVSVTYEQMFPVTRSNAALLVVPLIERPARSSPPPDAPVEPDPAEAAGAAETPQADPR